ncbi:Uu.00g071160.m01.CDS01 [Anthostomella pinea]|uniref:Uu.00g071160.m01.CDS01 n=1 Tax=Anthostomella pinea TaxID=933095 RepID=A0AAI8VUV5_9PEZI|nr:Uu.00g071160.m01.CDS01 [Anthostomella pinea]
MVLLVIMLLYATMVFDDGAQVRDTRKLSNVNPQVFWRFTEVSFKIMHSVQIQYRDSVDCIAVRQSALSANVILTAVFALDYPWMEANSLAVAPTTTIGDVATTACERCRRRKIKPMRKGYVQALERSVASLELFIKQLAAADGVKRDEMLAGYVPKSALNNDILLSQESRAKASPNDELVLARARDGQLKKLRTGSATQFFGGTSLFQFHTPEDGSAPSTLTGIGLSSEHIDLNLDPMAFGIFPYSPHDETCLATMADFFKNQYAYHMCLYREFFLRDYDAGAGRYYSEVLLYAICAMGALSDGDPSMSSISETFAMQAENLVYASLDRPDLTLLQALLLLGYRAIGHGSPSKGWLFCGMAFRLAHEMGLHLDPNNWNGPSEPQIDREISRRVYWAAFNADKQLSLYFGRPPALYPHESDVRNTIRIPYPEGWQSLLDTYIAKDISITAYEDGIALSGSFIYRVELLKIVHTMITDVFENRRYNAESTVLAATAQRIHVSLNRWLATLPGKLHWNQWSNGKVQPFVLHLHMLFHTAMIILHRPPRHMFTKPGIASSEDVELCYESLQAILKLLRSYSKFYKFSALPLDFVHTLSVAAGTILMKRQIQDASAEDNSASRAMDTVLGAMHAIKYTWPCIVEIQESVVQAMRAQEYRTSDTVQDPVLDFGFLSDLPSGSFQAPISADGAPGFDFNFSDAEFGILADDFLAEQMLWADQSAGYDPLI